MTIEQYNELMDCGYYGEFIAKVEGMSVVLTDRSGLPADKEGTVTLTEIFSESIAGRSYIKVGAKWKLHVNNIEPIELRIIHHEGSEDRIPVKDDWCNCITEKPHRISFHGAPEEWHQRHYFVS